MSYGSNRQSGGQSRNLAFMGGLINDDLVWARFDIHTIANDWNDAHRVEIIDRHSWNRSRYSEVVVDSLMVVIKWLFKKYLSKLTPAAGTLTGGRSLISKAETEVETPRLWAVCSITINQYIKMRKVNLNTYTGASGNLCPCSRRIRVTRCHKIKGASLSACRWRSCWPIDRSIHWTLFLGLDIFFFVISALHIDDDHSERIRISWLYKWI